MVFKPLFKGMRATNLLTAFILNAFVGALVATIIVEVRRDMDNNKTAVFKFVDHIVDRFDPDPFKTEFRKMLYTFIAGFFGSLIVYNILFITIGYGGGMIASKKLSKYF